MTRKLTFLILALFALISGPGWGQTYEQVMELDMTTKAVSCNAYNTTTAYGVWNITNGANNNGGWAYFKMGGKNTTISSYNPCYIYYSANSGVSSKVDKITVSIAAGSLSKSGMSVNSWGVYVYSDKSMTTQIDYVAGGTITKYAATFDFTPSAGKTWAAGYYYKVSWDLANTTSTNGIVCVDKITLYKESTPSTDPVINAEDVELAYNATSGEISYSITNPNPEASFGAETFASWISHLEITNDKVTFDTEVNTTAASRTATITLSYTGATSKDVTVTQAGDPSQISYAIDFESEASAYTEWEFTNMESLHNEDIDAYEGEYFGTTGGKETASITTKNKVATPGTLTCWVSKLSNNTTSSTWKIQVSSDKSTWTDVKTQSATSMDKGEWVEFSADLSNYTDVYVRVCYSGSTAKRAIDALDITKPSSVATPTFSLDPATYYGTQELTISCANEGATIYYTLDGSTPDNESTPYSGAINISETTTIKAIAYVGNVASNVATAVYTIIPTYASLAELVAAGTPTATGETVRVTITDEVITDFYTSGNYTNGIFLQVGDQEIEIYCYNVPENWIVGGTVSGILTCPWKLYGETWELCPENWEDLTYVSPSFAINIDENIENGSINAPAAAPAGTEISFTVTPAEGYKMAAESLIVMDATGEEVEVSGNNPYTFTMPASDVTISAEFELLPTTTYQYLYSVNGVSGDELEAHEGESITLTTSEDLNDDFTFAGWTTDENDVENILAAGSSYIVNDEVIFYAVYAKEGQCIGEKTVILDGSTLTSTATTEETTHTIDGVSYKFSAGAKKQAVQTNAENFFRAGDAVLIGKSGAYIHNDNPFGNGITKFEIYANKGASAKVSVGVYFSANEITAYSTGENTWTATLSTEDHVYDASEKLPIDAKYFWYQVTNANNSQIQFRITYLDQTVSHNFYTRVFLNETAKANITIGGPSIIPAGSTLNMGTYTLTNTNAANLIIEDGAQLIQNSSNVMATIKKDIAGYGAENTQTRDGYYLIANPTARIANDEYDALDGCTEFDLYTFDPTAAFEWVNLGNTSQRVTFERNVGYLFAVPSDRAMSFRGSLLPAGTMDIDLVCAEEGDGIDFPGFNLLGNPYTCNAYVEDYNFYTMENGKFILNEGSATIAPCEGFFVEATEAGQSVTLSTTAPATASQAMSLTVSQNRGNVIDRAIVNFDGANNLHKFMMNPAHTNLSIAKGGETFAAISTEAEGELPVNFKAEKNGTYTITVNTENVEAEYLHLIDNMTGMDTDLLSTPSYTFDAKTSDYASRFKLVFGVKNDNEVMSQASSFAYINNGEIVISNEGHATLQVIDVLGRIVSSEEINGECRISTNGMTAGLYILNLNGMTQKIVVR